MQFRNIININSVDSDEETSKICNKLLELRDCEIITEQKFETIINKTSYVISIDPYSQHIMINSKDYIIPPLCIQLIEFLKNKIKNMMLNCQDYVLLTLVFNMMNSPDFINFYYTDQILHQIDLDEYISIEYIIRQIRYMIIKTIQLGIGNLFLNKEDKNFQFYESKISLSLNKLNKLILDKIHPIQLRNIKWIQKINNIYNKNPFYCSFVYCIVRYPTDLDEYLECRENKTNLAKIKSNAKNPLAYVNSNKNREKVEKDSEEYFQHVEDQKFKFIENDNYSFSLLK